MEPLSFIFPPKEGERGKTSKENFSHFSSSPPIFYLFAVSPFSYFHFSIYLAWRVAITPLFGTASNPELTNDSCVFVVWRYVLLGRKKEKEKEKAEKKKEKEKAEKKKKKEKEKWGQIHI